MLCRLFCLVTVLGVRAVLVSGLLAADNKNVNQANQPGDRHHHHHATFKSADFKKSTVTFTTKDKDGKETEPTLPLATDAKIFGEDHSTETLVKFDENMKKEPEKRILIVEDREEQHIVEITDLPPKANKNK